MSVVDKALWVIERNSSAELTLPAVAEACGVSRSHIANAFGSTTGWPVMKYLRGRRLTRAAQTLAQGAPDMLAPPLLTDAPAVRAVGLSRRHTFDTVIGIPIQWQTFMETHYGHIAHRVHSMPIGIQKPADDDGAFDYICAAEVTAFDDTPPLGLERIEIASRRYAVFEHRDHASTIFETYSAIWNEGLNEHGLALRWPTDAA